MPEEKSSEETVWKRIRTITDSEYNFIQVYDETLAIARFKQTMASQEGAAT